MPIFTMVTWGGGGGGGSSCSRRSSTGAYVPLLVSLLLLSYHSTPAFAFGIGSGTSLTGLTAGVGGLPSFSGWSSAGAGTGVSTTTITAGNPLSVSELFNTIAMLFQGGTITTDITSGSIGGMAGSLALLAAAVKAPLVALYQISAEVVVMVALILFISYIASLLGIDDFRRRSGLVADPYETESLSNRGFFSNIVNSNVVQGLTDRVYRAIENFDLEEFLERIDTRN